MKLYKKLIISLGILLAIYIIPNFTVAAFSIGDDFRYTEVDIENGASSIDTDFSKMLQDGLNDENKGYRRLLHLFMPKTEMYTQEDEPSFLFYLKTVVNLLLSLVSLIALIMVIYAFYMIFFKKDEAGTTTAKQIIKGVIIALFIIGLSRIIVSFLYRFENKNTQNVGYEKNSHEITSSLT